jgi:beta-lactamase class A
MAEQPDASAIPDALTQTLDGILLPLGGRTALAAQRFNGDKAAIRLRADEVFTAASLAKIPIAIELARRIDLGHFTATERFDTADEPRVGGGGVLDYLDPATSLTLDDLCTLMLIVSDNTAANFLLNLLGMGEINETMSRLNLTHTRLARRFGDMEARAAHRDNVTTAGETLTLLSLIRGGALPGGRRIGAGRLSASRRATGSQKRLARRHILRCRAAQWAGRRLRLRCADDRPDRYSRCSRRRLPRHTRAVGRLVRGMMVSNER